MLKKFAAIGLSAAIALSPLAAFAQTDQAAPAAGAPAAAAPADQGAAAKPMKSHKMKSHKSMKKHKKSTEPAAAPSAPATQQ